MKHFSYRVAVQKLEKAQTLAEVNTILYQSCMLCPHAGNCVEKFCRLRPAEREAKTRIEFETLMKTTKATVNYTKTRSYNTSPNGEACRLLSRESGKVRPRYEVLAIDRADVLCYNGEYGEALEVLIRAGLMPLAVKVIKKLGKEVK